MKQLFLEKGTIKTLSVPLPPLTTNSILVKVHYSFISTGTEGTTITESKKTFLTKCLSNTTEKFSKIKGALKDNGLIGTVALVKESLHKITPLGYSCSGQVVAVGENVHHFRIGDFVACAGAQIANHAHYTSVPKNLAIKVHNETDLKQASITTIGAIALQGIRRAQLAIGENVCVIGLGLIGQLTAQLAQQAGCTVYGIDIDDSKLFLAQKLGCAHVYNAYTHELISEILFHTQHYGVDTTIITAASPTGSILQQAMEITRKKGRVVLVGDVKIDFNREPFYQKEIDFLISCSYGPGRYDKKYEQQGLEYPYSYVRWTENRNMQLFANMVAAKKITIAPLITHEYAFEEAVPAYETLLQKSSLGILLNYNSPNSPINQIFSSEKKTNDQPHPPTDTVLDQETAYAKTANSTESYHPYKAPENQHSINVGFIGAGGFAKTKLLPLISKIKNTTIHTIIDIDTTAAINMCKLYNATNYQNDFMHAITNKAVHAIIIATPHAIHTKQTIAALKAGKAVFVEKPAAVNKSDYEQLKNFLLSKKSHLYCVDFNRSFAPFILKIKDSINNRTTPLIIHYRMNAGFIPKDHWIQSPQNGGRIIGEACHIFELFTFLTEAKPKSIAANSIESDRDDLLTNDNFSVQITFDDGSLCSLLYTAIGNNTLPKERMEVYFDGKTIVMDDFKTLTGYGLKKSFNETTKYPDKGHENLLTQFFTAAKTSGAPSPISIERILTATKLSIDINEIFV